MPNVAISPVATKRDLDAFFSVPKRIDKGDPNWVTPLLEEQRSILDARPHPFREHADLQAFLARRDGQVLGRVVAIENRQHNTFWQDTTGFFGYFESIDDSEVAGALFDAAGGWLRERGLTAMRGPVNPSMNDECGVLIEGFDTPPTFMMTYNPAYYPRLLERCDFAQAKDLNAYYVTPETANQELAARMARVAERLKARRDIVIRRPDM